MTMTRQHFQLIAETIYDLRLYPLEIDRYDRRIVAEQFADRLAATNHAFDRQRFIDVAMGERVR